MVAAPGVTAVAPRVVTVTVLRALVVPAATPPKFTGLGVADSGPASLPASR